VLARSPVAFLATVSKMGRPRLSPVAMSLSGGSLLIAVDRATAAARELRGNPFFHVHAMQDATGEEFAIRGWASIVVDGQETVFELFADAAHPGPAFGVPGWLWDAPGHDGEGPCVR
jgi:Pyridoxamine 5'-phosphate oxidase